jgi:hypothetical protein
MTLSMTARLLTNSSKTTGFTTFVNGISDPVDVSITTNGLVGRIDEDNFKVLVGSILVNPVRVQNTQIGTLATDTFLGSGTERTLVLELRNTLIDRLTEGSTLGNRSLTTATTDTNTIDDIALLGLVT